MEENKIKIELTNKEADLFIIFKKYQKIWEKVFLSGIKKKRVVLHFRNEELKKAEIPIMIDNDLT